MKKLILAVLSFAVVASPALADNSDNVTLAYSNDERTVYIGHPSTIKVLSDAISIMVTSKNKQGKGKYTYERLYHAITYHDCAQGYGTLYARETEADRWSAFIQVRVNNPTAIGDHIAKAMCDTAELILEEQNKTQL